MKQFVWVFNGDRRLSNFPSGVFSTKELSEQWIKQHQLTGTLTKYPIDVSAYDWAINNGYFKVKSEKQQTSAFVGNFSSAAQEHYHYENGQGS